MISNTPKNNLIKFLSLAGLCLLLTGCLTTRPDSDTEPPTLRLIILNADRPNLTFEAPNPTVQGRRCVVIDEALENVELQMTVTDGGGMLAASVLVFSGDIVGTVGSGIEILPDSPDVRGALNTFGDDVLTLQFADRGGRSLNAASVRFSATGLPLFLHAEATDRSLNTRQFADTIEIRPSGSTPGGSCIGG